MHITPSQPACCPTECQKEIKEVLRQLQRHENQHVVLLTNFLRRQAKLWKFRQFEGCVPRSGNPDVDRKNANNAALAKFEAALIEFQKEAGKATSEPHPGRDFIPQKCAPAAAGQTCKNGKCVCKPPLTTCGKQCVDIKCVDIQKDPNNCGSCGNSCGAGGVCAGGKCITCTGANEILCSGGVCCDTTTHRCSTYGTACVPITTCTTTPPALEDCPFGCPADFYCCSDPFLERGPLCCCDVSIGDPLCPGPGDFEGVHSQCAIGFHRVETTGQICRGCYPD